MISWYYSAVTAAGVSTFDSWIFFSVLIELVETTRSLSKLVWSHS